MKNISLLATKYFFALFVNQVSVCQLLTITGHALPPTQTTPAQATNNEI